MRRCCPAGPPEPAVGRSHAGGCSVAGRDLDVLARTAAPEGAGGAPARHFGDPGIRRAVALRPDRAAAPGVPGVRRRFGRARTVLRRDLLHRCRARLGGRRRLPVRGAGARPGARDPSADDLGRAGSGRLAHRRRAPHAPAGGRRRCLGRAAGRSGGAQRGRTTRRLHRRRAGGPLPQPVDERRAAHVRVLRNSGHGGRHLVHLPAARDLELAVGGRGRRGMRGGDAQP